MSYTKTEIAQLILNKISGFVTADEEAVLQQWRQRSSDNEAFYQALLKPNSLRDGVQEFEAAIHQAAQARVPKLSTSHHPVSFQRTWVRAAASIILLLGIGAYLWISSRKDIQQPVIAQQTVDIVPGKQGAILTLADGSQVALDSVENGIVALQGGVTARVVNGTLQYEGASNNVVYNTMTTPKSRQFHVTLPDGTGVWLNAASSIRYPTVFTGKERQVTITGEAYFEVAKHTQMPFRVSVNDKLTVEVLGTHFNVSAYANENNITTTLLEGAVKVSEGVDYVVLKPGQQAQLLVDQQTASGISVIKDVTIDKVMAWKNGLFNFEGLTFEQVMRQLERWYDIAVVYEKEVPDLRFGGEMTRDVSLSDLLKQLKEMGVRYRLEERRLIVLPSS